MMESAKSVRSDSASEPPTSIGSEEFENSLAVFLR